MINYHISKNLSSDEISCIKAFYQLVGYTGTINESDQFFLAKFDKVLVGCVRLCNEFQTLVLRGMYVHPNFQGKGIGTQLLNLIDHEIGARECSCIPYNKEQLIKFYGKIGFKIINPESVSPLLYERYKKYMNQGLDVIVMGRCVNQNNDNNS